MNQITITDVAEHAQVSKSTVSQYLNKRYEYMSEKTKKRIEKSIKELGYSPNIIARSLTQKKTMTIGIIVANILHMFSTQVTRAIEDFCNEAGYHVIICNADDKPDKEKKYVEMLRAKQVDGIIAFPTGGNVELFKELLRINYPIVFMDRKIASVPVNTVLLENEKASELAIDLFISKGYRRIAMISPPINEYITPRIERIEGYKKALEANELPFVSDYLASVKTSEIQVKVKKILEMKEPPQALLAANDFVLFEVLKYVRENKIKIPKELALIGIDDVSFAELYNPELTTIAQPSFEMGKMAAELLLQQIKNKDLRTKPKTIRFEPKLIERLSC